MNYEIIEEQQHAFCLEQGYDYMISDPDSKVGFALGTLGQLPINGLRHLPENDTNGWYIWCGEELSSEPDFFSPVHTRHLLDRCPNTLKFLGLAPGYRFLLAGEYIDIWYDSSLLETV